MAWRDPIEIPRWIQVATYLVEFGTFLELSVVYIFVDPAHSPFWKWFSISLGVFAFIAVGVVRILEIIGNPEKAYVRCLLEELGKEIWAKSPDKLSGTREQHRITLFRVAKLHIFCRAAKWLREQIPIKRECMPEWIQHAVCKEYTHRLIPCLRVPRSGRRPQRIFYVHEHFIERCEGVAGQVYAIGQLATETLPDLHNPAGVSDVDYETYAKDCRDSVSIVKQERYYSRRIAGVTALVNGIRWGVLILDSSDPDAVTDGHLEGPAMRRTLGALTAILEQKQ